MKEPFNTYFKIFLASIFVFTAFFFHSDTFAYVGTIQTTAEQVGGIHFNYTSDGTQVLTMEKDGRTLWNGYATSTAGDYMRVSDPDYELPTDPESKRFYILSWSTDGLPVSLKYKNQDGTTRNFYSYSRYKTVVVDGENFQLFEMASTTAGDITFRDLNIGINRRRILFWTYDIASNVWDTITGESSAYSYMDKLNSDHVGSIYTPQDENLSEILSILDPTSGTTTPTTSVDFSFVFYNANDGSQVNQWGLRVYDRVNAIYFNYEFDLPSGEYGQTTETITLPASMYEAELFLFNSSAPDLIRSPLSVQFNVNFDPRIYFGIDDFDELGLLATSTCSIGNLSGCVQNAMIFLFYPSKNVLDRFNTLKTDFENKPPFGYIAMYTDQLANLSETGEESFELVIEENISNKIFSPLKTGLSSIIWVCFGFWIFNRIRKQEI